MVIEVKLKKFGNSIGILLPEKIVKEKRLKHNEKILIDIFKIANLSDIFGSLKLGMSAQKMKDESRKIWNY